MIIFADNKLLATNLKLKFKIFNHDRISGTVTCYIRSFDAIRQQVLKGLTSWCIHVDTSLPLIVVYGECN